MADSGNQPPPDVGFKDVPPSREGLEALAALVGMTNARLKELDSNLVDGSSNIKAQKFDPEAVLQGYADSARSGAPPPPATQPQPQPQPPPSAAALPSAEMIQGHVQPVPPPPVVVATPNPQLEQKLDLILAKLDILENSYSMVVSLLEKNLKNKIKTITFKLNDQSKDTR